MVSLKVVPTGKSTGDEVHWALTSSPPTTGMCFCSR